MKRIKLGEVLDVKRGASLAGEFYSERGEKIRLTLGNFKYPGGGFKQNNIKKDIYFNGPVKPEFILNKGDIITPLTEQVAGLLGETARIPEGNLYIQSGDIGLVIPDERLLDKDFAYYLVSSPLVKKQLDAAAQQTKIRHTSPDAIKDCVSYIPELMEQKKIAKLLDAINDKVTNNNAIAAELEGLAKDLYDYWFVQFDFPDENGKPYKSSGGKMVWNEEMKREIPEGWDVKALKGLYQIDRGLSYTSKDIEAGVGVPMLNLACVDTSRNYRDGELKYHAGKVPDSAFVNAGDLMIACTDLTRERAIIGCPILVPDDGLRYTYSMDLAKISFPSSLLDEMYMYMILRTEFYHNYIKEWASGTTVLHLNLKGIDWYNICIPPMSLQEKYATIMRDIHSKKSQILSENRDLVSLRNFLLPMLMNGQVKVKGA